MKYETVVIEYIKTRRSVREYLNKPVPEENIKKIIDAGRYAPTGLNLQPWRFVVVENNAVLKKLSEFAKPILIKNLEDRTDDVAKSFLERFKSKDFHVFHNAPVLILVLGSRKNALADYDCSLCAGYMMLAAHSLGLGSCWVGGGAVIQQSEGLMAELKIPINYKIVAPLIFGYPKAIPPVPKKHEPAVSWVR